MPKDQELFELLAGRRRPPAGEDPEGTEQPPAADGEPTPPSAPSAPSAPAAPAAPRRATDLVIRAETALAVFIVVAALVVTAYLLGRREGEENLVSRLQARLAAEELPRRPDGEPLAGLGEYRRGAPALPADAYLLRLTTLEHDERGRALARDHLAYAAEQEVLEAHNLRPVLLENETDGGAVYVVAVGPFAQRNSPAADEVMGAFQTLPGPRTATGGSNPYAGAYVERVAKLGREVR
jgi:hypothetical protein